MIQLWLKGKYACFTRPELKVERVSYDIPTPSALRNIIEAIYWHPGLEWIIDRFFVLTPIMFTTIRRNEVSDRTLASSALSAINGNQSPLWLDTTAKRQLRASTILQNVEYVVEAHFEMTGKANESDNPGKFQNIIQRRIEKGQCFSTPYFGTREFPADFSPWPAGKPIPAIGVNQEFGIMLYDLDYRDKNNITPIFYRPKMDHGMVQVSGCEVYR